MNPAYKRKVSFNSLTPNLPAREVKDEDLEPLCIPPQYLRKQPQLSEKDLNFGWEPTAASTHDVDRILEAFQQLNNNNSHTVRSNYPKKAPKLPPPPHKSCIKNWKPKEANQKKKSLLGLTDEELLERDRQFSSSAGVDLNKLKFNGDTYLPMLAGDGMRPLQAANPIQFTPIPESKVLGDNIDATKSKKLLHNSFRSFTLNFETIGFRADQSKRYIAIYINNHHEFHSLLWALKSFVQENDNLIIIYEINENFNPFTSNTSYVPEVINSDTEINNRINRFINYYFHTIDLLKVTLNLSVTFEIIQNMKIWKIMQRLEDLFPNLTHLLIASATLDSYHLTHNTLQEVLARNKAALRVVRIPRLTDLEGFSPPSTSGSQQTNVTIDSDDPLFKSETLSLLDLSRQLSPPNTNLDVPYNDYLNPGLKKTVPKITFSNELHPERNGQGLTLHPDTSRDGSIHSRRSSGEIRKVKSLLDDYDDSSEDVTPYNGSGLNVKFNDTQRPNIKKSLSNTDRAPLRKQSSHASAVSVDRGLKKKKKREDDESSASGGSNWSGSTKKKGFFGFFGKKKS
ncbi:hypothetical protein WICPIJ_009201 [Wickerhamomyces pijperi]|uniref:Uncharacterized protein n=1 Tax=Wickerhamomyces pijperi TaxID=599730 RepID=A0A9P8TEZ2_WICPI|nr:hypothetical protein WICPIJ_009201 [Wickerhamomyces pijperi]